MNFDNSKIDVTKEIFCLSGILTGEGGADRARLSDSLGQIARATDADRAYLNLWDSLNHSMVMAAQWNADHLEPMTDDIIHLDSGSLLNDYLEQSAGMFRLHVEPVLHEHRLLGLLCLESSVPISRQLNGDEQHFVRLATQLMAPLLNRCQCEAKTGELNVKAPAQNTSSSEEGREGPLVLIVEDNHFNQIAMEKIWIRVGARVQTAGNGVDAIQQCNDKKFDLILMDLHMPVMDGFDTAREIVTSSSINSDTPIVAITAVTCEGTETRCKKVGMVEYVMKPLRLQRVKELYEQYLSGDA